MENLALTAEQQEKLLHAFAEVAVLIGSADGEMDEEEKLWSQKITNIRTFSGHEELFGFYKHLNEEIGDRINAVLKDHHEEAPEEREEVLVESLSHVNDVLAALTPQLGFYMYSDLRSYADHIAKASGGFLRFFSVSPDEKEWVELPMIHPIIWAEEEE